ncbi:hypothetical protein M422DRAFT_245165 [Sphaerobolus stellatus SS14]|nr:hypothetical protein M422DRAFT_245165 [Sphaerobolus stellatus SS14]
MAYAHPEQKGCAKGRCAAPAAPSSGLWGKAVHAFHSVAAHFPMSHSEHSSLNNSIPPHELILDFVFDPATNGPSSIDPHPTSATITDSVDYQGQTSPPNPNPHRLHTSHFIGPHSAPNVEGYANSGALVAQTQGAGDHVGITSYPSQEVQHSNFWGSETIPPSNIEDFHVQSTRGLASDYSPPSQSYPSDFNVDHGELPSYYIATGEDSRAGGVPQINFNAYATSDPTVQSNDGHTDAGNVVVPNGTNIKKAGNSSLTSVNLKEPLPNIPKSVPNKKRHGILPFTPPEERNTEIYISNFTTTNGRPFFGCLWKGCRGSSFWEHAEARDHVYKHFLQKGYECSCGSNFATEQIARRHCCKQANTYECAGCSNADGFCLPRNTLRHIRLRILGLGRALREPASACLLDLLNTVLDFSLRILGGIGDIISRTVHALFGTSFNLMISSFGAVD